MDAIFSIACAIVNFVTKRPKVLSIYQAHDDLVLLKPPATRFAYMFIVVERLMPVRQGFLRTVVSLPDRNQVKSHTFVRMIMDDTRWHEAKTLIKAINPIYIVLHITDMEGSTQWLLYDFMDRIVEDLNRNTSLSHEKY